MAPRRIAFVNQREGGGATAVCRDLEAAVRREGHATLVAPRRHRGSTMRKSLVDALRTPSLRT
jgi:hypothetical protein